MTITYLDAGFAEGLLITLEGYLTSTCIIYFSWMNNAFFFIPNNCDKGYLDIYIVLSQASARNIRPHDALHFDPHLSYLFTGKYHFLGYEPIFRI